MVLVIIRTPWPISKGLDHSICMSMFACFYASSSMLASLVLAFATLDALSGFVFVWLHLTPMRPCLDLTIWEASSDAELLRAYASLFRPMQCYVYHTCLRHQLAFYASLFACLQVYAWVLLASVSSILQHEEAMDIRSKPTLVPLDTTFCLPFCLFVFFLICSLVYLASCFLACLFILWLVMSPVICYAYHVYHAYLLFASFICSLHVNFVTQAEGWSYLYKECPR